MDKKAKQKVLNNIVLNFFLIAILYGGYSYYLQPEYDVLAQKIITGDNLYKYVNTLTETGVDAAELERIMSERGKLDKTMIDMLKEKQKINKVIQKTDQDEKYIDWLKQEVVNGTEYSVEDDKNKKIIGNIIPIFYQYSASTQNQATSDKIKGQITLESFTKYIEEEIIKKYNITSYSTLGIDNISFGTTDADIIAPTKKQSTLNENIGSFTINLDLEGKNNNILALIDSIQKSGKLEINSAGKLINKVKNENDKGVYSSLDNLLINIDELKIASPLLPNNKTNKGAMKLRFYVRGIGYEQLNEIKNDVNSRIKSLYTGITSKSTLCDTADNPICKDNVGSQSVAAIRNLVKDITQAKTRLDALIKDANNASQDVNQTLSSWVSLSTQVETIDQTFKKSLNFIDNFNKQGSK